MKTHSQILIAELKRQTNCTSEDIQDLLQTEGKQPVCNRRMGTEIQKRFEVEDRVRELENIMCGQGVWFVPEDEPDDS